MYTKLLLNVRDDGSDKAKAVWVQEDWDTVFNHVFPVNPPASNEEARQHFWYTKHDGLKVAIHPSNITIFEEVEEGPDI